MKDLWIYMLFVFIYLPKLAEAYPQPNLGGSRQWGTDRCRDDVAYMDGPNCCLYCPAGNYVKSPCTTSGELGTCVACGNGTFTEHANGLKKCFKCTQCRDDQETVRWCTLSQNTECRCKSGRFCDPDHACEVCKKCSRCKSDEVIVRNCTSTTDTECKKTPSPSSSVSGIVAAIVVPLVLLFILAIAVLLCWRCRVSDSQSDLSGIKTEPHYTDISTIDDETQRPDGTNLILSLQPVRFRSPVAVEEERKMLCESLTSSASNSEYSLTGVQPPAFPAAPTRDASAIARQNNRREEETFPILIPKNGEQSLRRCFEYFEELDMDHHKRFFRQVSLSDNVIKSKEQLPYEDRIHELLNIWVEKEGKEASLNDLLRALISLNQRRTAETIMENAIQNGHYVLES
ncbi:tumor necrosis factor receptor superfamily member 10B-like isoform 1-T1 [Pholidichthys leucotaenia]